MYVNSSIAQLSKNQISKLLNGHPVTVKYGSHHKIGLSHEQHKKLNKAHSKNSGVRLILDPYQQQMHQHLKGEGFISTALKIAKPIGREIIKHAAPIVIDKAAQLVKSKIGRGRPKKKGSGVISTALRIGKPIAQHVAPILIDEAGKMLKAKIGRGRPRKRGGALNPAGYGFMGDLAKSTAKHVGTVMVNEGANMLKNKIAGSGVRLGRGRPKTKRGGKITGKQILSGLTTAAQYAAPLALSLI